MCWLYTPLLELPRDITAIRSQHTHSGFLNHVISLPKYDNMTDWRIIGILALAPSSMRPAPMVCYIYIRPISRSCLATCDWATSPPFYMMTSHHCRGSFFQLSWEHRALLFFLSISVSLNFTKSPSNGNTSPATEDIYHSQYHSDSVEWILDALVLGCFEPWHNRHSFL